MCQGLLLQQKVTTRFLKIETFFHNWNFYLLGAACLSAQGLARMEKRTSVFSAPSLRTRCSVIYLNINSNICSLYFTKTKSKLSSKVFDTLVQKGSWNYHKMNVSQSEGERKCRHRRDRPCGWLDGLRLKNKRRGSKVSREEETNEDCINISHRQAVISYHLNNISYRQAVRAVAR